MIGLLIANLRATGDDLSIAVADAIETRVPDKMRAGMAKILEGICEALSRDPVEMLQNADFLAGLTRGAIIHGLLDHQDEPLPN